MPTKTEEIVVYNSPEAATYRTDIKGWVSRNGLYCGQDEDLARYKGVHPLALPKMRQAGPEVLYGMQRMPAEG